MAARTGAYTVLARCRGCHSTRERWREIYRMDPMPLAGEFDPSAEAARAAATYPLTLIGCERCGLVQVLEDVDDAALFTRYSYTSSTVPGLVRHFEAFASSLAQRYGRGPLRLLEIGCNDGVLLRRLPAEWRMIGVDPSDVARAAAVDGYELIHEPFGTELADRMARAPRVDVITSSNALAHTSDIRDMFEAAHRLLRDGGEFYVEVHDLAAATGTGQWDVIYHEHKAEWSADALVACVSAAGFELADLDRLPLHGGLLRARFRRTARGDGGYPRPPEDAGLARLADAYRRRRASAAYERIAGALARKASVAAYGASGRGNVWMNQMPEIPIGYVVDDSPARAGRWIPRLAVPIVAADELRRRPPDLCVVTAWDHAGDIRRRNPDYAGEWVPTFGAASDDG